MLPCRLVCHTALRNLRATSLQYSGVCFVGLADNIAYDRVGLCIYIFKNLRRFILTGQTYGDFFKPPNMYTTFFIKNLLTPVNTMYIYVYIFYSMYTKTVLFRVKEMLK